MKHERIFVAEFHGIPFSSVPALQTSKTELPDAEFYAALYREIMRRGGAPVEDRFIRSKEQTADVIAAILQSYGVSNGAILSWGAGLGIVEGRLAQMHGYTVDGIETEKDPRHWSPAVAFHRHISELPEGKTYEATIEVSTLYALSDDAVTALLDEFARRTQRDGVILVIEQDSLSLLGALRSWAGYRLIHRKRSDYAFWGYRRSPASYMELAKSLRHIETRFYAFDEKSWLMQPTPPPIRFLGRQVFGRRSRAQLHVFKPRP